MRNKEPARRKIRMTKECPKFAGSRNPSSPRPSPPAAGGEGEEYFCVVPRVARSEPDWPTSQPWAICRNPVGVPHVAPTGLGGTVALLRRLNPTHRANYFSRPCGTCLEMALVPALKRRAILSLSLRDDVVTVVAEMVSHRPDHEIAQGELGGRANLPVCCANFCK